MYLISAVQVLPRLLRSASRTTHFSSSVTSDVLVLLWPRHHAFGTIVVLTRIVFLLGFYVHAALFPTPRFTPAGQTQNPPSERLLLGPFSGRPACQLIHVSPEKARGVCADAYLQKKTLVVPDVEAYPGHIACDGETKSEVVIPLLLEAAGEQEERAIGVLDLDSLALEGFDDRDRVGLERIAKLVVDACDW